MPVDSKSKGSWIGVNSAGLFFSLLNLNEKNMENYRPNPGQKSRGLIVSFLLGSFSLTDSKEKLQTFNMTDFPPFRLLYLDVNQMIFGSHTWNGRIFLGDEFLWSGEPLFYTSSGLGDSYVYKPRHNLFMQFFRRFDFSENFAEVQDSFHMQRDDRNLDTSIFMERSSAMTVSRSVIEINKSRIKFIYHMPPENQIPDVLSLERS